MKIFLITILLGAIYTPVLPQNLQVYLSGNYTTSGKVYLNPKSSDPSIRNRSYSIVDIYHPGIEVRGKLIDNLFLSISADYVKAVTDEQRLTILTDLIPKSLKIEDGFIAVPVELSISYRLPFSDEHFKYYMNGGFGYYFGSHYRKIADIEVKNLERQQAYGIQVGWSMEYIYQERYIIHGGMKFRDPQFNVKSSYNKRETVINGQEIYVAQETFDSKINIDGITFFMGIAFTIL